MKNNWQVKRLEEVTDIYSGGTPRRSIPEYWGDDVPWLTMEDTNNFDVRGTVQHISSEGLQNSNAQLVPAGSVNLSCTASVGNVTINRIPLATNQQFNSFHPHEELVTEFLAYQLIHRKRDIEALGGTTTFSFINKTAISKFKVQVPPMDTQKKIANILFSVDKAIQKTDDIIQKIELLKQGLMRELLTKGISHKKFKQTKIGKIPEEWETHTIKQVSEKVNVGFVGTCERYYTDNSGIPMIRTGNIKRGELDLSELKYVTKDFNNKNKKSQLIPGDILIARHGDIGQATSVPNSLSLANCLNVVIVRANSRLIVPKFLAYFINSPIVKDQIKIKAGGSTQNVVNTREIANCFISLPDLNEQKEILIILENTDEVLDINRQFKNYYLILKKGLMNDIFSQKVQIN